MFKKTFIEIIILVALAFVIVIVADNYNKNKTIKTIKKQEIKRPEPDHNIEYGIITDSLIIIKEKVKRNENLSEILLKYNVDYATIDLLAKKSKHIFDVRKIKYGNNYTVLYSNDSMRKVQYLIYEDSPTSYVVFYLKDSVKVYAGKKTIKRKIKTASGIINSSLWDNMKANGTNPYLSIELSEIYTWTIDFFDIKKGDKYRVIYEDLYVDEKYIGLGKVLAACFYHDFNDYYAFYFEQDSVGDYFDDNANSLQRTFLKAPLRYRRISSKFSNIRWHPILKIRRPHHGVDYAAPIGTPVHAIGDGIIIKTAYQRMGAGRYVKIKHNSVYSSLYGHLSRYAKGIKRGVYVKQGQTIAYVGMTGLATGPHLDFRIFKNGKAIDPLKVKSPPAKPINSANIDKYNLLKLKMIERLDSIKILNYNVNNVN